jgi:uncharacterized membrane protein (GlpM family)
MVKKAGFTVIGIFFLGIYIVLALKLFSGSRGVDHVKNEIMFGSISLLGSFIFMSLILFIICYHFIDKLFKEKRHTGGGHK